MWWTGMGFSSVNRFLGKADIVLQHISSWHISVKRINTRMCFSRVYAVHQRRASVGYFNMNKIMSFSLINHFSFCTWANLPVRKTFLLIFDIHFLPWPRKNAGFQLYLGEIYFHPFWGSISLDTVATVQTIWRTHSVTETSWLYIGSQEKLCADGLEFGLFVLADHYLSYWLFMPCVYPGIIFERAAVVQQCTVCPFTG